jgi:hypothetical protein
VLEIVGQPPTVLVLAPSAQTDKSVVQGGVVEDPDNVARPIDRQAVPQAAPLTDQRRESLGASEALLTDFSPEVVDFGVAPSGGVDRFANR